MNSLLIGIVALILLGLGYRFYGKIAEKLWGMDPARPTPAVETPDGVDYVPAKHWTILFGHHFASIAGAGPILGPVIAAMLWGWLPALIWIVLGSIFLGGIHDFSTLMISIRHKGRSIADVTEKVLNFRSKVFFAAFISLSLILVMAVFAAVTAKTLMNEPKLVIPTFGLILVAILLGLMIYKWNWNHITATILGIILLCGLLILGNYVPISLKVANPLRLWILILLAYAFIASVLPVNILLQPRDYLSTFILFFGLFFGYLGLIITHPVIHTPAFISWRSNQGHLWPMLCVIIACGAISGFHSLIASGTTSKQIANEKDAKKIGYGGMILEGVLAVLALICVTAGLYWSGKIGEERLVYPELMKSGDWIGTFSAGFGQITRPIFGASGPLIAAIMLNAFVMTTLDSATRINRYITEELFGEGLKIKIFRNRYFSTAIIIAVTLWLALGNWQAIWPIFGASNQLVAALVLMVVSAYLINAKKPGKYTIYPAIFMLLTTGMALIYQIGRFFPSGQFLLGIIGIILLILAIFLSWEALRFMQRVKTVKKYY
ncbi:MAG: carbon starvation protein A [Candidatus Omnitrophota bacterium]|nr:MAG: carbon starvation protein A [Candidatus Omnitrophota bacterium]